MTLWGVVGMSLFILNHYILVFERKWYRFEREFESRPKLDRVIGGVAVWVSLILIVAVTEWAGSIAWKLPPY